MSKSKKNKFVRYWRKNWSNLLQESRFSNGTSRSTRQGAPFLILMFKINPRCRLILSRLCDLTAPFDTEFSDNLRAIKGTPVGRSCAQDIIFFSFRPSASFPRAGRTNHDGNTIGGRLRAERHESLHEAQAVDESPHGTPIGRPSS